MPTPPPVPATNRYPVALRDFLTYQNQPGDSNRFLSSPDPTTPGNTITTDLTLDAAAVTRDIQTEIVSMEQTIGIKPFKVPGQTNLGKSINWLFHNLSPGHADASNHNVIIPLPPTHTHIHADTVFIHAYTDMRGNQWPTYVDNTDDHPQYVRVDGSRGFTAPVTGRSAVQADELITLAQAQGAGLTAAQVNQMIQNSLTAALNDATLAPCTGPWPGKYKLAGGYFYGPTDVNGNIFISFSECHFSGLVTFVYGKNNFPGGSMLDWPTYQYEEDQLILLGLDTRGALIQFIEDIVVDRSAMVAMTWTALGI
jgi:hypothetical protein